MIDLNKEAEKLLGIHLFPFDKTKAIDQRICGAIESLCSRVREEERERAKIIVSVVELFLNETYKKFPCFTDKRNHGIHAIETEAWRGIHDTFKVALNAYRTPEGKKEI